METRQAILTRRSLRGFSQEPLDPAQEAVSVDLAPQQQGREAIRYWDDETGKHYVPKRALSTLLHWQRHGGK